MSKNPTLTLGFAAIEGLTGRYWCGHQHASGKHAWLCECIGTRKDFPQTLVTEESRSIERVAVLDLKNGQRPFVLIERTSTEEVRREYRQMIDDVESAYDAHGLGADLDHVCAAVLQAQLRDQPDTKPEPLELEVMPCAPTLSPTFPAGFWGGYTCLATLGDSEEIMGGCTELHADWQQAMICSQRSIVRQVEAWGGQKVEDRDFFFPLLSRAFLFNPGNGTEPQLLADRGSWRDLAILESRFRREHNLQLPGDERTVELERFRLMTMERALVAHPPAALSHFDFVSPEALASAAPTVFVAKRVAKAPRKARSSTRKAA